VRESFAGGYNVRARGESYFLPRDILDAIEKHYRAALKKRGCFKGALGIEIFRHSDGRVSGAWVVSDNVGGAMAQATIREFVRGKDFHVKAEHLHIKSTIVFLPNVKELRPRLKVSSDEFQVRFGYKSYPAEVEFGPLKHLEGKQDLKKTHRMFLRHQGKIRTCYQIELKKMEKIEGKVGFRFEVNAGGRVNEVAVLKNELNETAEACLLRAVKRIRFEKSEFDKNSFEVTFEFRPLKKEDQP